MRFYFFKIHMGIVFIGTFLLVAMGITHGANVWNKFILRYEQILSSRVFKIALG